MSALGGGPTDPWEVLTTELHHWRTKAEAYHKLLHGVVCEYCKSPLLSATEPCQHSDTLRKAIVAEPFYALDADAALTTLREEKETER